MPTMAEYAKSGGYANDNQVRANLGYTPPPSNSGSSGVAYQAPSQSTKSGSVYDGNGKLVGAYLPGGGFAPSQAGTQQPSAINYAPVSYSGPNVSGNLVKDAQGRTMGYNTPKGFEAEPSYKGTATQPADPGRPYAPSIPSNGLNGNASSMPGQYSGGAPQAYTPPAAPQYGVPASAFAVKTPDQIKAEAKAAVDALVAKQTTVAGQTKQGFQTTFDRAAATTKDDRTLQDASFQRNTNPFSGGTDYKSALIGRERETTDRQSSQDLASRLANVDLSLADYVNASESQRMQMETDMTNQERAYETSQNQLKLQSQSLQNSQFNADRAYNYGVGRDNVGDARYNDTTNYDRGRDSLTDARYNDTTAYNRGQDQFNNGMSQAQLALQQQGQAFNQNTTTNQNQFNNNLATTQQQQSAQNQTFNQQLSSKTANWNAYMESVGLTGNLGTGAKADWALLGGTDGAPTEAAKSKYLQEEGTRLNNEMAKLQLNDYPQEQKLKMQQLQKQIEQIGKAPYQSAQDVEFDKIKLDTAKEQLKQLSSGKTIPDDEVAKMIESSPLFQKQYDDDGKLLNSTVPEGNKQQLAQYIASLGLPADQAKKWFVRYGLWTGDSGN